MKVCVSLGKHNIRLMQWLDIDAQDLSSNPDKGIGQIPRHWSV